MSPLLPESVYVGLFPGHCWLQRGRKGAVQAFQSHSIDDLSELLQAVDGLLTEQKQPLRKGARLIITVSDSVAAIAPLPWQEQLSRPAEVGSYARICYEKLGVSINDDWTMYADFRQFGGMGLAYALPQEWLKTLLKELETKGLKLSSILPLSASMYHRQQFQTKTGLNLALLQDAHRITAMVFSKDGLRGYDTEPIAGSVENARLRLLRRIETSYADIAKVFSWSCETDEPPLPLSVISTSFPNAKTHRLQRHVWN